jgi:hypothetical protein
MHTLRTPLAAAVAALLVPGSALVSKDSPATRHFQPLEPASWLVENERGDPQKAGPCGGSNTDWGEESYIITPVTGGQDLRLRLRETVYHPGHYRVALAINSATELPPDPETVTTQGERGPMSVSAVIQNPAVPPVLADGLFQHSTRPAEIQTYEANIPIPNVNCEKCVLQVVQWMAEHAFNNPGGYSYHHCANLQITADPTKPIDTRWPAQRR